jgi:hypothetical protein
MAESFLSDDDLESVPTIDSLRPLILSHAELIRPILLSLASKVNGRALGLSGFAGRDKEAVASAATNAMRRDKLGHLQLRLWKEIVERHKALWSALAAAKVLDRLGSQTAITSLEIRFAPSSAWCSAAGLSRPRETERRVRAKDTGDMLVQGRWCLESLTDLTIELLGIDSPSDERVWDVWRLGLTGSESVGAAINLAEVGGNRVRRTAVLFAVLGQDYELAHRLNTKTESTAPELLAARSHSIDVIRALRSEDWLGALALTELDALKGAAGDVLARWPTWPILRWYAQHRAKDFIGALATLAAADHALRESSALPIACALTSSAEMGVSIHVDQRELHDVSRQSRLLKRVHKESSDARSPSWPHHSLDMVSPGCQPVRGLNIDASDMGLQEPCCDPVGSKGCDDACLQECVLLQTRLRDWLQSVERVRSDLLFSRYDNARAGIDTVHSSRQQVICAATLSVGDASCEQEIHHLLDSARHPHDHLDEAGLVRDICRIRRVARKRNEQALQKARAELRTTLEDLELPAEVELESAASVSEIDELRLRLQPAITRKQFTLFCFGRHDWHSEFERIDITERALSMLECLRQSVTAEEILMWSVAAETDHSASQIVFGELAADVVVHLRTLVVCGTRLPPSVGSLLVRFRGSTIVSDLDQAGLLDEFLRAEPEIYESFIKRMVEDGALTPECAPQTAFVRHVWVDKFASDKNMLSRLCLITDVASRSFVVPRLVDILSDEDELANALLVSHGAVSADPTSTALRGQFWPLTVAALLGSDNTRMNAEQRATWVEYVIASEPSTLSAIGLVLSVSRDTGRPEAVLAVSHRVRPPLDLVRERSPLLLWMIERLYDHSWLSFWEDVKRFGALHRDFDRFQQRSSAHSKWKRQGAKYQAALRDGAARAFDCIAEKAAFRSLDAERIVREAQLLDKSLAEPEGDARTALVAWCDEQSRRLVEMADILQRFPTRSYVQLLELRAWTSGEAAADVAVAELALGCCERLLARTLCRVLERT